MSNLTEAAERWRTQRYRWLRNEFEPRKQQDMIALADFAVDLLSDPLQLVKPLEWEQRLNYWWTATSTICHYRVVKIGNKPWHWTSDDDEGEHECPSLEAGKAACEADYRERLRGIFKAKE